MVGFQTKLKYGAAQAEIFRLIPWARKRRASPALGGLHRNTLSQLATAASTGTLQLKSPTRPALRRADHRLAKAMSKVVRWGCRQVASPRPNVLGILLARRPLTSAFWRAAQPHHRGATSKAMTSPASVSFQPMNVNSRAVSAARSRASSFRPEGGGRSRRQGQGPRPKETRPWPAGRSE